MSNIITHVTIPLAGEYGIGNQMFQIASTIGIARTNGYTPAFSYWRNSMYFEHNSIFCNAKVTFLSPIIHLNETNFDYNEIKLNVNSNVALQGYFQSERYFENAVDEVRSVFKFNPRIVEEVRASITDNSVGTTCSISVRRGDYVKLANIHPQQDDNYWYNAQLAVESNFNIDTYIVFSDDIDWCMENSQLFRKTGKRVLFMKGRSSIDDLIGISLCDHNIITNSTFSWWGAWLNKNTDKVVVAPKLWFGVYGPRNLQDELAGKDLIPKTWITL